ncbi:MAG: hypothetical protein QM791_11625 [Ferruginibacter sp.]
MKKYAGYFLALILSAGLFLTSCKKEKTGGTDTETDATEVSAQADDQEQFAAETDDVTNDVNASIENKGGTYTGRPLGDLLPVRCDVNIVFDTASAAKTITLTYNGNCLGDRTRTGVVVVSFANNFRWNDAGASFTVNYQNLKITRKRDNKSITINGTITHTNVTGGLLRNLSGLSSIVHEVKSDGISVIFNNGTARTWKIAKRRTFTYDNGIVISVKGIGAAGNGVAEWGVNRFGTDFTTSILADLVIKQSCEFRLVSGKVKHTVGTKSITTTFGLDKDGNAVTNCPLLFYFKVEWTAANGGTASLIFPY